MRAAVAAAVGVQRQDRFDRLGHARPEHLELGRVEHVAHHDEAVAPEQPDRSLDLVRLSETIQESARKREQDREAGRAAFAFASASASASAANSASAAAFASTPSGGGGGGGGSGASAFRCGGAPVDAAPPRRLLRSRSRLFLPPRALPPLGGPLRGRRFAGRIGAAPGACTATANAPEKRWKA
jgi:hypothetical protein